MKWTIAAGFLLLIVGLCLWTSGPVQALPPTLVNVSPSTQNVNTSQTFNVSVYITPGEPIAGAQFDLAFNATLLQANSVTERNLLNGGGCSTFFNPGTINNTAGTITGVAGAIITPSCTVTNPGTFANISFTARNVAGTSLLNMSNVVVGAMNGSAVDITVNNGSARVLAPGITVTPTSGLVTTEAGGTANFTIVLDTLPASNVVIGFSSNDTSEGTVSPSSVTFTTANWFTPRTITATGQNDFVVDGNMPYTIITANATSTDPNYNGLNAADVGAVNNDNDVAGFTVNPTAGLVTTEAGGTASFTIVLTSQPTANVVVNFSSSDVTEGTVSPASVTFGAGNWSTQKTITATGQNDFIDDGNIPYTIITAPSTSADPNYNGPDPADVAATNNDNDTAGFTVTPTSGLVTTEAGGTATFTIRLNSEPTADVIIGMSSSDPGEGTAAPLSVTFGAGNWSVTQTITATGQDDFIDDGNIAYTLVTAAATSADPVYNGLDPANVAATNNDNDTAGITVTPTSGLVTTEAGGTATFNISLNTQPAADVSIGLSSSDLTEGTVAPLGVTFGAGNWSTPQTVTVTGQDDLIDDGNVAYNIVTAAAVSADPGYNGMNPANVAATNTDDDTAGITVTPTAGLVTTEGGGTATFNISLDTQPTANVNIGLSSSDLTEGTVAPAGVTFSTSNWSTPRTVTVTGVNDFVDDGDPSYNIVTAPASSTDQGYNGRNAADVSVTNQDDDTAGITVTPTAGLVTTEGGGTATFTIVLDTQPTASVTIGLSSSDTSEGTVAPTSVTFTTANWNTPRTITATGVDDVSVDGNVAYTIITAAATSTDPNYNTLNAADVSATNNDNDSPGITVNPTSGLITTEAGGTATFTIVLNTQPTADVNIGLTSDTPTEGTVAPTSVTFGTANWSTPRIITVTGQNDFVLDGDVAYNIVTAAATSGDSDYNGIDAADVSATNREVPGITVTPTAGLVTTEAGGTATFNISLNTLPTANVRIGLTSSDLTEGTVAPASVTFGAANWSTPQTVIVTGVDDFVDDGDVAYNIVTAAATSADPGYNGLNAADVGATNNDDDTAGITVDPTSGLVTNEGGGTDTFTIVLDTQPTASVTIGLSSSDLTEGTVAPTSVSFTTVNWNTPRTITATGVDDIIVDGNQAYTIVTAAATSTDPNYGGRNADDVAATNNDNDVPGVTVNPTRGLITTEDGGTATFTIVLNTQPTADVSIGLSSDTPLEGTAAPAGVTFSTANWSTPRTITVTGVDDALRDGDIVYNIVNANSTSADSNYNDLDVADVGATNIDNDAPGITVNPTSGLITTEAGGTATFTIVLNASPTADVVVNLSSSDTTEGNVSPPSVTFNTTNWNIPQTITVTGVSDNESDGSVVYTIVTDPASSGDTGYDTLNAADVSVTNRGAGGGGGGGWPAPTDSPTPTPAPTTGPTASPAPTSTPGATPTATPAPHEVGYNILGSTGTWMMDGEGVMQGGVEASSPEGDVTVNIPAGVKILGPDDEPIDDFSVSALDTLPDPPEGAHILAAFDFEPDGATFTPGIEITIVFDPSEVAEGEEVVIAYYNEETGDWETIAGTIGADGTATFTINHTSVYAVLVKAEEAGPTPTTAPAKPHKGGGIPTGVWIVAAILGLFLLVEIVALIVKLRRKSGPKLQKGRRPKKQKRGKDNVKLQRGARPRKKRL